MTFRMETVERLRDTVNRVFGVNALFRERMRSLGMLPDDVRSIADFRKVPFMTKQDLRDRGPFESMSCPREAVVRLHASSGTSGTPTFVPYSKADLENWTEAMADCLRMAGVTADDIIQVAFGYGLFTGGLGFHYGGERIGATVIPAGGGFTERQLMLMESLGTTVLACTPSYALHLAERIEEIGVRSRLSLRIAILGGEAWSGELRDSLQERLGVTALNIYGLSEIMGPGVAMECPHRDGMHIDGRRFFAEVVDPETFEPLPDGETGELVLTPLGKEALPLVRYRTRDLTSLTQEPCACGRGGVRIGRVPGRNDDMLIIRGVNVFPSQIESVLPRVPGLSMQYRIDVSEREGLSELALLCEAEADVPAHSYDALAREAVAALRDVLGIRVGFRIVEPGALGRSDGKASRVRRVA
jgi:phenylacetate-CoA ligase